MFVLLLAHQSMACLWDRDTLAEEAKGRADLVKLVVGWFDRYPPEYYNRRLERVSAILKVYPENPDLYDDAAVACDRLGRQDEAIEWMAKKKLVIDKLSESDGKEHRYRYLANLGTFHAHRWVAMPKEARDGNLSDLRTAEKLIAQAIKENPEAHFGREVYQLMAIRWMLWDGVSPIEMSDDTSLAFDAKHWVACGLSEPTSPGAVDGIAGLIQLGAAWQSVDAFRTLGALLDKERLSSIAELAYLRENELIAAGKGSLHPVASIRESIYPEHSGFLEYPEGVREYFPIARAAADRRNEAWVAYQKERIAKGMHPDTHADFWKEWTEPEMPELPGPPMIQRVREMKASHPVLTLLVFGVSVLLSLWICRVAIRRTFARKSAAVSG